MIKYISISLLISSIIFSQEIIHTEKHSTGDYIVYIEYYRKNSRGLVKTKKETYHPNGVMSSELFFRLGKIGVAIVSRSTSLTKLKNVNSDLIKLIKVKKIEILKL